MAQLDATENNKSKQEKIDELISYFSLFVFEKMQYGKSIEDVESVMEPANLGKNLTSVFDAAIELARLIARQRASFTLNMNDLTRRPMKIEDDKRMTTMGSTGVALGNSDDGEAEGLVMFCVSPMLVKWGNGQGRNFNESSILVKSYVTVFEN